MLARYVTVLNFEAVLLFSSIILNWEDFKGVEEIENYPFVTPKVMFTLSLSLLRSSFNKDIPSF